MKRRRRWRILSFYLSFIFPSSLSLPLTCPSVASVGRPCVRPSDRPTTCPTRKIAPSPLLSLLAISGIVQLARLLGPPEESLHNKPSFCIVPFFLSRRRWKPWTRRLCLVWKLEAVAVSFDFFEERFVRLIWNGELHKPSNTSKQRLLYGIWMAKVV